MEKGVPGRAPVQLTNAQEQLINVRVAPVERAEATKTVRAVGYINYDQTKVADLNSKVKEALMSRAQQFARQQLLA